MLSTTVQRMIAVSIKSIHEIWYNINEHKLSAVDVNYSIVLYVVFYYIHVKRIKSK